jgi:hypothetical protein
MQKSLLSLETYDPNRLLDTVNGNLRLRFDAALARKLEVCPAVISNIRKKRLPIGATLLLKLHYLTDLTIRDLKFLMGDTRPLFH